MRKAILDIPVEDFRTRLVCDSNGIPVMLPDGRGVYAIDIPKAGIRAGDPAGTKSQEGYFDISIGETKYRLHRVFWALATGESSFGQLDHANGIKTDNRIANLSLKTNSENVKNVCGKGCYKNNDPKHHRKPWRAQFQHDKKIYKKDFATEAEARQWYLDKKWELAGHLVSQRQEFIGR